MEEIKLTQKEYDQLAEQLKNWKEVKAADISERIKEARSHGDLSENAEYTAALAAQEENDINIKELEKKLNNAVIIDTKTREGVVSVSNIVTIEVVEGKGMPGRYKISNSAHGSDGTYVKISEESPVAKALIGHQVGDVVTVKIRNGNLTKYEITKIEQDN